MPLEAFDWKTLAAIGAGLVSIISGIIYLAGIAKREVEPHPYTWLIWTLTFAAATVGVWHGGASTILLASMFANLALLLLILMSSFRLGTRNLKRVDAVVLAAALVAMVVWWFTDDPLLAILIATAIDLLGYIPTYRKSYAEPWTESVPAWSGFALAPAIALLALEAYNPLTVTYTAAIFAASTLLVILLLVRRRTIRPS